MRARSALLLAAPLLFAAGRARADTCVYWITTASDVEDRRTNVLLGAQVDVGGGSAWGSGLWGVAEGWIFGDWYFRLRGGVHPALLSWRGFDAENAGVVSEGGATALPEVDVDLGIPVLMRRVEVTEAVGGCGPNYVNVVPGHAGLQIMTGARFASGDSLATVLALGVRYGRKVSARGLGEAGVASGVRATVDFFDAWWVQARALGILPQGKVGFDVEGRWNWLYAVVEWVPRLGGTPRAASSCTALRCEFSDYPWSSLSTAVGPHLYVGIGVSLELHP